MRSRSASSTMINVVGSGTALVLASNSSNAFMYVGSSGSTCEEVEEAANLTDVPLRQKGTRLGNWLTREQAKDLLAVPHSSTLKGKRDYVLLALLVGCALRRTELAELQVQTIQLRENRCVLADLEGKGRRIRTVAVPLWVKQGINAWMAGCRKDRIGKTAGDVAATASAVVAAIQAHTKINSAGEWVEKIETGRPVIRPMEG